SEQIGLAERADNELRSSTLADAQARISRFSGAGDHASRTAAGATAASARCRVRLATIPGPATGPAAIRQSLGKMLGPGMPLELRRQFVDQSRFVRPGRDQEIKDRIPGIEQLVDVKQQGGRASRRKPFSAAI